MRKVLGLLAGVLLGTTALAQEPPAGEPPAQDYTFDFAPFIEEVDTDGNGMLSLAEWKAAGVCDSIFTMLHGGEEGEMTIAELTARMPQKEADQDEDGKLNVAEMTWVCTAGPSGPPPEGAPPGDAPAGGPPGDAPPPQGQ
jgi:hypothetical protein